MGGWVVCQGVCVGGGCWCKDVCVCVGSAVADRRRKPRARRQKKNRQRTRNATQKKRVYARAPARRDIVGPEDGRRHVVERGAREPKVADLELAVGVGEDVFGLEVAVEDLCAVDVLEAAQHLVEEKLVVLGRQVVVRLDDLFVVLFLGRLLCFWGVMCVWVGGCVCW